MNSGVDEWRGGAPALAPVVHHGLPPVIAAHTRMLVLGSFPGAASLAAEQYYAHPRNQFWPLLASLWPQHAQPGAGDYAGRCQWLLARGLGLWDVYAACERTGSLDSAIRHGQINDFALVVQHCPNLTGFAHNGGESARHGAAVQSAWQRARRARSADIVLSCHRLPSTSAAYAAMSFGAKCDVWRSAVVAHGLL